MGKEVKEEENSSNNASNDNSQTAGDNEDTGSSVDPVYIKDKSSKCESQEEPEEQVVVTETEMPVSGEILIEDELSVD